MSAERITLWDDSVPKEKRKAVFGRSQWGASRDPAARAGLDAHAKSGGADLIGFRRSDADRRPPREVVTARFLGDPRPNRLEEAEAIRRRVMAKVVTLEPVSVALLLRALLIKSMGANEASGHIGCSPSAASDRAKRARAFGYVEVLEHRTRTGRLKTYKITDAGRAYLDAQGQ